MSPGILQLDISSLLLFFTEKFYLYNTKCNAFNTDVFGIKIKQKLIFLL